MKFFGKKLVDSCSLLHHCILDKTQSQASFSKFLVASEWMGVDRWVEPKLFLGTAYFSPKRFFEPETDLLSRLFNYLKYLITSGKMPYLKRTYAFVPRLVIEKCFLSTN